MVGEVPAPQSLSDQVSRGAALAGAGFVLSRGLTFVSYFVIAQLIVPKDAGEYVAATAVVGMGFVFSESGMLAALIHWPGDVDRAMSTATLSSLITGVALSGAAVGVAPAVGWYFQSAEIGSIAAAASGLLLLNALAVVPDALLQRRFSFVRRVVVDPLASVAFATVAIVCCASGLGAWGLLAGTYARFVAQVVASWAFVGWRPRRRLISFAIWRQLASYARHVVASEVVRRSGAQLDSLLLGRFGGTALLGEYGYGFRFAATAADAWTSVGSYVLLPVFARIATDLPRFRRAFHASLNVMLVVSVPVVVLLLMAGKQIALASYGPRWAASGLAIQALAALVIGHGLVSVSSEAFKAAGRPQLLTRTHFVGLASAAILLPTLLWALPDLVGVAAAVAAASVVTGLYALVQASRVVGVHLREIGRDAAGVAAAGAISIAALWLAETTLFVHSHDRLQAALQVGEKLAIVAVVYTTALRFLAHPQLKRVIDATRRLRSPNDSAPEDITSIRDVA